MNHTSSSCSAALAALAWVGVAALASAPALAQGSASGSTRIVQAVFVIDDSASMSATVQGQPAADPDRLAVFAVRSLISMLDDVDEATVVRLNAPDEAPALRPLGQTRRRLEEILSLSGALARYDGELTPCRDGLDRTADLLAEGWRPGAAQIVVLLTDGRCNPGDQAPDAEAMLERLTPSDAEPPQLYLLRFAGRAVTPSLGALAAASGGQTIDIRGDEPTGIVEPFADALTRAQGFEAELLTPARPTLAAHPGAERVRLLVVAEGDGPPLTPTLADARGAAVRPTSPPRTGMHRYERGATYRYVAVDVAPTASGITLHVDDERQWRAVAVPEYRLGAHLTLRRGHCSESGAPATTDDVGVTSTRSVETGSTVCADLMVVDDDGRPLLDAPQSSRSLAESTSAEIRFRHGGDPGTDAWTPMSRVPGDTLRFVAETARLAKGRWTIEARAALGARGSGSSSGLLLKPPPLSLDVSSYEARIEPARLDFGVLRPGARPPGRTVHIAGNFPQTHARLEVDRHGLSSCVTFAVDAVPEGESFPVHAGGQKSLEVRVAGWCGAATRRLELTPTLRLVFAGTAGIELGAVSLPVTLDLDLRLEAPSSLEASLRAGESADLDVPLRVATDGIVDLALWLPDDRRARPDWPAALTASLQPSPGPSPNDFNGRAEVVDSIGLALDPESNDAAAGRPSVVAHLQLDSGACCPGGMHRRILVLGATDSGRNGGDVYGGPPPPPLEIPLIVHVEPAGTWACRGPLVLRGTLLLLGLLVVLYAWSMVRNTQLLSRAALADALVPLRWDRWGEAEADRRQGDAMRDFVRRAMPWHRRLVTWLKANPFVFGLPGRSYRETVHLRLEPETSPQRTSLRLVDSADWPSILDADPALGAGSLYASAQGGSIVAGGPPELYGVLRHGRIDRLSPLDVYDDDERPRVRRFRRRARLLFDLDPRERDEGRAAGWQLDA
ncbi:MAG: vWA domain-containing protein [Acidobacteriota bacterium]